MDDREYRVELRSEKMRKVIGRIPNILIRIGIGIIGLTILLVFLLSYFLPYPNYIESCMEIYTSPNYFIKEEAVPGILQYSCADTVKEGDKIYNIIVDEDTIISRSPISGSIVYFYANNASISEKKAICKIVPLEIQEVFGIVYLSNYERSHIEIGEKVDVTINSKKIDGFIVEVFPLLKQDDNLCVKVVIDLTGEKSDFIKQMPITAKVKIMISNKPFFKRVFNS